ncbi:MAG: 4-phosphopantoate--beta-alanine ligase [Fervidicoccaceae archaeon]
MSEVHIPKSHPRYRSLVERELIVEGLKQGIVVPQGLIAHGRGEAFDYIIGERTIPAAMHAIDVSVARILLANHPVISVNGNTAALVPREIVELSRETGAEVEVNLFYRTEERVRKIADHLKKHGANRILGEKYVEGIPGLESERRKVDPEGILKADVVLVMLEDGDRTEYLKAMGKFVIAIDLNPFSRTARKADITIMDNVTRALPVMIERAREMKSWSRERLESLVNSYSNSVKLSEYVEHILNRLREEVERLRAMEK